MRLEGKPWTWLHKRSECHPRANNVSSADTRAERKGGGMQAGGKMHPWKLWERAQTKGRPKPSAACARPTPSIRRKHGVMNSQRSPGWQRKTRGRREWTRESETQQKGAGKRKERPGLFQGKWLSRWRKESKENLGKLGKNYLQEDVSTRRNVKPTQVESDQGKGKKEKEVVNVQESRKMA